MSNSAVEAYFGSETEAFGQRDDLYKTVLHIPSLEATYVIDKLTGGAARGKAKRYTPANGAQTMVVLAGPKEIDNATCTALFDASTMNEQALLEAAGEASVILTRAPLNDRGEERQGVSPLTYKGVLLDFVPPPTDSEGGTAAKVEFVLILEPEVT
jgi:hypothetical protein